MNRKVISGILTFSPDNILPIHLDTDLTEQEKDRFLDHFLQKQYVNIRLSNDTLFGFRWIYLPYERNQYLRVYCVNEQRKIIGISDTRGTDRIGTIKYGFEPEYDRMKDSLSSLTDGPYLRDFGYPAAIVNILHGYNNRAPYRGDRHSSTRLDLTYSTASRFQIVH